MPKRVEAQDLISQDVKKVIDELKQSLSELNAVIVNAANTVKESKKLFDNQSKSQSDLKNKTTQLTAAEKELERIAKAGEKVTKETILASEKLAAKRAKLREEVRRENAELQKNKTFTEKMTGAVKNGAAKFTLMATAVYAAARGISSFIGSIINVNAEFQKYNAVLSTALGSEREARMEMQNLKKTAASTPFSVNELTNAYVKLVNQGFKPTTAQMIAMGDLASSTGKGFDQLTEAIIDAQTGEFERLKEFGVRAKKEGDKVKFTFKGVETQVAFTNDAIRDYIVGLGETEGVSGSMAKISETLGGKISNLGDNWTQMLDTLGNKSGGIFTIVIGWINSFVETVTIASKTLEQMKAEAQDKALKEALIDDENEVNNLAKRYEELGLKTGDLTYKQYAAKSILEQYKQLLLSLTPEEEDRKANILEQISALEKLTTEEIKHQKTLSTEKIEEAAKAKQKAQEEAEKAKQKAYEEDLKRFREQTEFELSLKVDAEKELNEELAKIDIEWNEAEQQAAKDSLDLILEYKKTQEEKAAAESLERTKKLEAAKADVAKQVQYTFEKIATDQFNGFIDNNLSKYQENQVAQEAILKKRLENGELNEREYEANLKALRLKTRIEEAKAGKKKALFEIALDTFIGSIKAVAESPTTFGQPFLANVLKQGLFASIGVAAEPLPKYFKGTGYHPGGGAVIGDKPGAKGQHEYVMLPNGEGFISPNRPTYMDLPKGTKVFPEHTPQTQQAMRQSGGSDASLPILKSIDRKLSGGGSAPLLTERGYEFLNKRTKSRTILSHRSFN